jgi:hypothetical protein
LKLNPAEPFWPLPPEVPCPPLPPGVPFPPAPPFPPTPPFVPLPPAVAGATPEAFTPGAPAVPSVPPTPAVPVVPFWPAVPVVPSVPSLPGVAGDGEPVRSPVFVNSVPPSAEALVAAARNAASASAEAARRTARRCVDGLFMVGEGAFEEVLSANGTAANSNAHDGRGQANDDVRRPLRLHVPCHEAAGREIPGNNDTTRSAGFNEIRRQTPSRDDSCAQVERRREPWGRGASLLP